MRAWLFERIGVPAGAAYFREDFAARIRALEQSQWDDPGVVALRQLDRLRALVAHARAKVPLYRDLYKDLRPEDLRSLEDARLLPPVTKEMLRDAYPERVAAEGTPAGDRIPNSTSGSTGTPLPFFMSRALLASKAARYFRGNVWAGARPGERIYQIWGKQEGGALRRAFIRHVAGRVNRSAFEMDERTMARYVEEILVMKPRILEAYTSAAHALARYLRDAGVPRLPVGAAVTSGETLADATRALVAERVAPVWNRYGSREFGAIAHECEAHDGLHVHAESFLLEAADPRGKSLTGEPGRLLVTCFDNVSQPFIRYEIGDVAILEPPGRCPCGRGLPRLREIQGRMVDLIVNPDGQVISVHYLTLLFEDYSACVRRFQAVQTAPDALEILLIPSGRIPPETLGELGRKVEAHAGPRMRVTLRPVEDIPAGPDGKRRLMKRAIP